ncbi:hypothetical protein CONCODRAFT_13382 [Conidiobolus coronatus NRRL 28638]|uniref:Uncharacterized protein n=1 Tax=Conidiobolus coronatus (strain ATCC 28846 / CBS 209.66 / NRRL 28638) TaxID=796925 RepID=A0A137NQU7_CONC2|nr:hypothetical protein CONCODRAFT_13382 [Conidiobolus coronatus NRRL 28638]|eukprot:KXN65139.1 hypothetical protein CONCODRAFT_13382 [Conidiobolus coronatus NRRL 28638]
MKFTAIFLTGAALAQHAIVFPAYGPPQPVKPVPGECTLLSGIPIINAFSTPDIGLKFYTGHECDGDQVATNTEQNFKPKGDIENIHSVKVVPRHELTNEEASYLSSPNKYNNLNNLKSGMPKSQPDYYIYWGRY